MTDFQDKMRQDMYLRNSARALVKADIQNLRDSLDRRSIAERAMDRVAEGAGDVYDEAIEVASDHKGALAAILAALALWFARHPLLDLMNGETASTEPDTD